MYIIIEYNIMFCGMTKPSYCILCFFRSCYQENCVQMFLIRLRKIPKLKLRQEIGEFKNLILLNFPSLGYTT